MGMAGPSHLLSVLQLIHQGKMAGGGGGGGLLSCVGSHSLVGPRFLERGNKILHHPCPLSPDQQHFIFPAECGLKQGKWHRLGAWAPYYGSIPQASASGNSFL